MLLRLGRSSEAEKELRSVLADEPQSPLALAWLALCRSDADDHAHARDLATQAVGSAPDLPYARYVLARVLLGSGRVAEAEKAALECTAMDPANADPFGLLALIRSKRFDWAGALSAADEGLACDPEHNLCVNMRAMALTRLGQRDLASSSIEGALSRRPDDAFSHANLGWTKLHLGDHRSAEAHFREALRLDPQMEWARDGVLESLKARNPIYRLFLRYKLWMDAMSVRRRFGVILGGYVVYRIAFWAARVSPAVAPLLWAIVGVYLVLVLLTWFADPIFNFTLLLHPLGRLALNRRERLGAAAVCAILVVGGGLVVAGLPARGLVLISGLWLLFLAVPTNLAFEVEPPTVARRMATFCGVLVVLGSLGLWLLVEHQRAVRELAPVVDRMRDLDDRREALRARWMEFMREGGDTPPDFGEMPAEVEAWRRDAERLDAETEDNEFQERLDAIERQRSLLDIITLAYPLLCVFGSQFLGAWLAARAARR